MTDIFNDPYAAKISTLYDGTLTGDQINSQLTTSVSGLLNPDFIAGFSTVAKYSSVKTAFDNNSITAWHSYKPLMLMHGSADADVNPLTTENLYTQMIGAGTSADICKKVIVDGVDHSGGIVPCMTQGLIFLNSLKGSK